ncbi:MAG: Hsp20/alpha crystallin family protein [Pseudomonadota bacterium]
MYASLLNYPGALFGDFERLRRELDDVFESAGMPANIRSVAPGAFPAINVGNTPEALEVYAFAPGIDAAKLEVTVDRGVLTIAGERPSDLPSRDARSGGNGNENTPSVFSRERLSGSFRRAISLPEDADPAQITAQYSDGVLHVSVARKQAAQPTRITVQ